MLRVFADDCDPATAADDFAFNTYTFDGSTALHGSETFLFINLITCLLRIIQAWGFEKPEIKTFVNFTLQFFGVGSKP